MRMWIRTAALVGLSGALLSTTLTHAASSPERAEAMKKLAFMNGVWRGPASGMSPEGNRFEVTQTERIGPMLDGDVIVIEGRGYQPDGAVGFNAFAIVSWDQRANKYEFRSYAHGHAGTFEMKLTDTGFVWEVPAGPDAVMRYTATVQENHWHEVGEYVSAGTEPRPMFEMHLERIGDTAWPSADPVPMK